VIFHHNAPGKGKTKPPAALFGAVAGLKNGLEFT